MDEKVKLIENEFIDLKDGVRLSSRIWLPANANEENPVPAIFEFIPYRKRDVTATRDEITHQHFALNGYASLRIDMRGSGDSTGLPQDELMQYDAVECIEWMSRQSWCTGDIGMMGISWGGANTLKVAAQQPKALKAITAMLFTDDWYSEHTFFKGGALQLESIKRRGTSLENSYSLPPDPLLTSEWFDIWLERLHKLEPQVDKWLNHQTRDGFWKSKSIREEYSLIKAATFLLSGYADGFRNTVKSTFDNLQCPKRAIVGPWMHVYPHFAVPEPQWGFCTEAVKWWDKWLKKKDVPESPSFISYLHEEVPVPCPTYVQGTWISNPVCKTKVFYLCIGRLGEKAGSGVVHFESNETCGSKGGSFCCMTFSDLPCEQSVDDALSEVFETDSFESSVRFCGKPELKLVIASDKPVANVFARLCIVNPNGDSRLIAYSAANLNHDDKHESVTLLKPGVFKEVWMQLDLIGECVKPSYKLRLSVSGAYFPMFLPNPERTTLSLDLSQCQLNMPLLTEFDAYKAPIPEVTHCKPLEHVMKSPAFAEKTIDYAGTDQTMKIHTVSHTGVKEFLTHGLVTEWSANETESIRADNSLSAVVDTTQTMQWSRGEDWKVNIKYRQIFSADRSHLYVTAERTAKYNDSTVFHRQYNSTFKRNGI